MPSGKLIRNSMANRVRSASYIFGGSLSIGCGNLLLLPEPAFSRRIFALLGASLVLQPAS